MICECTLFAKGFHDFLSPKICEMQRTGSGTTRRDLAAKVPYFVNTNTKLWVGFEDKQSVRDKVII